MFESPRSEWLIVHTHVQMHVDFGSGGRTRFVHARHGSDGFAARAGDTMETYEM